MQYQVCHALRCFGLHARYTDAVTDFLLLETSGNPLTMHRDGDRVLQVLICNEAFLVSVSHQLALITSLPFVHTARRSF